jgi:hypothetical protein
MKTYSVKIERTVYFDKNYEIRADNNYEAGDIAVQLAEDEWQENAPYFTANDWVLGDHVGTNAQLAEETKRQNSIFAKMANGSYQLDMSTATGHIHTAIRVLHESVYEEEYEE